MTVTLEEVAAMDVILKVIDGAKVGAKVAIKKPEFLIGRSKECHLCAGSSAVSRQHCAILRGENRVTVKDLGSRNGTLVNGTKIEGEVELVSGDEITVGPLKFMLTITAGIANEKRPQVKTVAQAVERVAATPANDASVDDISKWLNVSDPSALNETQTIRIDDTNAAHLSRALEAETAAFNAHQAAAKADEAPSESGLKNDTPAKREPGKLPKVPTGPSSKDSREAAAEALRNWSRRR
jgi:pSer/pThr/pTyr-binding forkhead associated (FHA) protein